MASPIDVMSDILSSAGTVTLVLVLVLALAHQYYVVVMLDINGSVY